DGDYIDLTTQDGPPGVEQLVSALSGSMSVCDLDWSIQPLAISLPGLGRPGYTAIRAWAGAITQAFDTLKGCSPLVVLCSHDVANALGQCLRILNPSTDLVCLDGLVTGDVSHGAYVDIGAPLAGGKAVPVVLRTMIFDT
ncbi:MAG: ethanolamine ammonia-lyase reactivating factor EutA, partial [Candidatus Obscuribacterales bacterium]